MAVDPTQILRDAECILACIPHGMVPFAQLGQMLQPSIVQNTLVAQTAGTSLLLSANPKRRRALIQNMGTALVWVGNPTVTSATGYPIASKAATLNANSRLEVFSQGELYQTAGTVGQNFVVTEFLVP